MERIIGRTFLRFLEATGAYGRNQWAFRSGHSCRDLITLRVLRWLNAIHTGRKSAIFLSDISGAFDRVGTELLLKKYERAGVGAIVLQFLSSFFAPRTAKVIVQGSLSKPVSISNQVYQGTVLGPPSWNVFFADVVSSVIEVGFSEDLFADDLTCEKYFPVAAHEDIIFDELRKRQSSVHAWGSSNRVRFDPLKEEFKVIHNTRGVGDSFK